MRRTWPRHLVGGGAVALVLTGCTISGGTSDNVTATAPSPRVESSAASRSPSVDATEDIEDESSDSAVRAWMGSYCTAVGPVDALLDEYLHQDYTGQTAEQILQTLIDNYQAIGVAYADAGDAVSSVGIPPVDGGQEISDALVEAFADAASVHTDLGVQLAAIGTEDADATEAAVNDARLDLVRVAQQLDTPLATPALVRAFRASRECKGVDWS